jgi:hypothetical protein
MTTAGDMLYEGGGVDQVLGNASYTGSSGNGALATDGDDATSFHPANGDNASWRAYDLGSAKTIASWRIKQSSATATKIQTSADGSTGWTDQATYSGLDSGPTNFGSPVTARYWRFLLSGFYDIYTFSLTDAVVPARLAKGTAGQVMTQGAAAPTAKRSDADRTKVEEMWRDRYDEMKTDRDTAIDIAEKAVGGYTSVADAIKERNRLDTLRLRNLQAGLPDPTEQPNEAPDPPGVTAEIRRTEQRLRTRRKA